MVAAIPPMTCDAKSRHAQNSTGLRAAKEEPLVIFFFLLWRAVKAASSGGGFVGLVCLVHARYTVTSKVVCVCVCY